MNVAIARRFLMVSKVTLRRLDLTLAVCTCGFRRMLSTVKAEEYKQWHECACDGIPRGGRGGGERGQRSV
jgi:hypothetical protein